MGVGVLVALLAAAKVGASAIGWKLWTTRRELAASRARFDAALREHETRARDDAASAERERIYQDLHDDLGARLLTLIYEAPTPEVADRAREILQDLRDTVTRSRGTPGTLDDVLADIRAEAAQRLGAAGIALAWDAPDDLPSTVLDTARALHLHRIAREAISNVIRHARAARLRVRVAVQHEVLRLELTDDGLGPESVATAAGGSGVRNMRERADALAGEIRWAPGTGGGTKVLLSMPLAGALPRAPEAPR